VAASCHCVNQSNFFFESQIILFMSQLIIANKRSPVNNQWRPGAINLILKVTIRIKITGPCKHWKGWAICAQGTCISKWLTKMYKCSGTANLSMYSFICSCGAPNHRVCYTLWPNQGSQFQCGTSFPLHILQGARWPLACVATCRIMQLLCQIHKSSAEKETKDDNTDSGFGSSWPTVLTSI
jgi:hypothetical protein